MGTEKTGDYFCIDFNPFLTFVFMESVERKISFKKLEDSELPEKQVQDIGPEEALHWIAHNPVLRSKIFPPALNKALEKEHNLSRLFRKDFKHILNAAELSKELTDDMTKKAEGEIRPEFFSAIKDYMKEKFGLDLPAEKLEKYKILFLDEYRWPAFFVKTGRKFISQNAAQTLAVEKTIIVNAEKRFIGLGKEAEEGAQDSERKTYFNLLHEFLHTFEYANFWEMKAGEKEKPFYGYRRLGLRIGGLRENKVLGKNFMRAVPVLDSIDEGVIESLTNKIAEEKLSHLIPSGTVKAMEEVYGAEQEVVRELAGKLSFEALVKAVFERESLKDLVKKSDEEFGPRSLEIVGELMNWEKMIAKTRAEDENRTSGEVDEYSLTLKFLRGEKIRVLAPGVFRRVPEKFVRERYPNMEFGYPEK